MTNKLPRVVIIGAGFGGLWAARALSGAPVEVILIDQHNYHLFQPLLYQVATAGLAPEDIVYPVRTILRRQANVKFKMAEVTEADLALRRLITTAGIIDYDYLIVATGGVTNFFGMESVAKHGFGLKNIDDVLAVRNHILRLFELAAQEEDPAVRRALLTFIVVGGGPTGVESAGALAELVYLVMPKDYPDLDYDEARIILMEASNRLLAGLPVELGVVTAETLARKRVEVRFGNPVADFDGETVTLKDGETIQAHTLIWAAGIRAARLADKLGVKQAGMGRLVVKPTLQLPKHPEVMVIGDAAYLESESEPLPMVAPVATQQARTAADNIRRLIGGQAPQEFVYKNPGVLATIGRNAAVAHIGKWQFKGFIAWVLWLVIHIVRLIGFRNRITVLINWAWDYFFYERAVRVIMLRPAKKLNKES
ncbi:NADH dehydrogenase-like protein [Sporomusa carbonis]|uniref:NAD(P)/FAD-dependent oxidoreductase n=1 Tax=Sporomusa carbonis TaxID=3076075 RepID=UPI003A7A680C